MFQKEPNDTKSEVQCIVEIFKVFKVLFHTSNIDMKNWNIVWLQGEYYLVSKEGISWKKLISGSTSIWIELSFTRKGLQTEDSQSNLEFIVFSIKDLSNGMMRIGNDVHYNCHSCLNKQLCDSLGRLFYPHFVAVSHLFPPIC